MNFISLSEIKDLGILCNLVASLKYNSVMCVASLVLLNAMKCAMFKNISTITKIRLELDWVCISHGEGSDS